MGVTARERIEYSIGNIQTVWEAITPVQPSTPHIQDVRLRIQPSLAMASVMEPTTTQRRVFGILETAMHGMKCTPTVRGVTCLVPLG
jgi:hypothetical protein